MIPLTARLHKGSHVFTPEGEVTIVSVPPRPSYQYGVVRGFHTQAPRNIIDAFYRRSEMSFVAQPQETQNEQE